MQRVTLSVDDDLLATLDRHMKKRRYASRSEALRDILREAAAREALDGRSAGQGGGLLHRDARLCLRSRTRDLGRRLTQAQHRHHDLQVATLHVHLDHDSCLEVSVLRGPVKDVRAMADDTVSQRGVRHGQLNLVPAELDNKRHGHGGRGDHDHIHA